jgi:regulatory protein
MMRITNTRPKGARVLIEIDGTPAGDVEKNTWIDSGLGVGSEITQSELEALRESGQVAEAKRRALNMLSRRSYSKRVLTDRIAQKTGDTAAQTAVGRMEELGLLNDDDYARRLAQECFWQRGFAKRRILQHLYHNGIDRQTAEEAAAFVDIGEEPERAFGIVKTNFGRLTNEKQRRKAFALLERLGYSRADALSALRRAADNTEFEDETWD